LSRGALEHSAKAGRLERIGIYLPSEAAGTDWELIEAATRRPDATICLTSALVHRDVTETIPAALDVAIPRASRTLASTGRSPGITSTAPPSAAAATTSPSRDRIRRPTSTPSNGPSPTPSGCAATSDTSSPVMRCGSDCGEAESPAS